MIFDSMIFDLDGTLWDSTKGICGTWTEILLNYPELNYNITEEILHSCMGLPLDVISSRLFPGLSAQMQKKLMDECCIRENEYLRVHGGEIFPNTEKTLKILSKKFNLYIVSNCQTGYIESFLTAHKFWNYFNDIECYGNTGLSKGQNILSVIRRYNLKKSVYIGDTQGDADAAKYANIPFIFAEYGFGNTKNYDFIIRKISDLINIAD